MLAVSGKARIQESINYFERLVSAGSRGIRVAVIKHDGHEFEADAGNGAAAYEAGQRVQGRWWYPAVVFRSKGTNGFTGRTPFPFRQGFNFTWRQKKQSDYPKIEVLRRRSRESLSVDRSDRAGRVTDGAGNRIWVNLRSGQKRPEHCKVPRNDRFNNLDAILEVIIHFRLCRPDSDNSGSPRSRKKFYSTAEDMPYDR